MSLVRAHLSCEGGRSNYVTYPEVGLGMESKGRPISHLSLSLSLSLSVAGFERTSVIVWTGYEVRLKYYGKASSKFSNMLCSIFIATYFGVWTEKIKQES